MNRQILVVLVASIGGLLLATGGAAADPAADGGYGIPAHARVVSVKAEGNSVKPQTKEETLAAARQAGQPKEVFDKIAAAPQASGCWVWKTSITYTNVFNQKLMEYINETHWCGDGNWIYGAWFRTFGQTYFPGWSYDADGSNRSNYSYYGDGWNVYRTGGTGYFCYVRYFSCVSERHPWMEVYVGAGGQRYSHRWRG
jgi:hypothetical protein